MKIKINFKSIRTNIIFYFSSLILLTTIIFVVFSINFTKDNLKTNSEENSRQLIEQVNLNIENYINYMENISQVVVCNNDVKNYLFGEISEEDCENLKDEFSTILQVRKDIYNIAILGKNKRYFINDGSTPINPNAKLEDKKWYRDAKEAGARILISSSHVQNMVKDDYKWVVTLSRGIVNPKTKEIEGILIIDLNYDVINNLCEAIHLGNKGYVYILDEKGEIVYHPQQQLILSGVKKELLKQIVKIDSSTSITDEKGEDKIYTPFHSKKTGWTIVGVTYTSELVKNEQMVKNMYVGMGTLLILLAVLLGFLISSSITKPIKQLQEAMKEVQKGRFQPIHIESRGDNEIASLNASFNIMIARIEELMKKNNREQAEKRKSEMKALQSQINPHFLYNTLDSIIWLIETDDSEQAIKMTSVLAKFFRLAIGNSDIYVTVEQEIEYTKSYLIIQQMRYKDKLTFEIDVDEEILQCPIIKLIIQPLVENGIYHGLKYKKTKGSIRITGHKEEDKMIIKVIDDGIGMNGETLENIYKKKKEASNRHNGIGMKNVQDRISLYYGEDYGLTIDSKENEGTVVTIIIPCVVKEELDEGL